MKTLAKGSLSKPNNAKTSYDERLFPFQLDGVRFLEDSNGRCIIGDEMGLGKTVQALCWAKSKTAIKKILVVAPSNVTHKWKREVETWTDWSATIVVGYTAERDASADVVICSYNVMTHRYKEFRNWDPDLIIWDEAHYLKGNRKKTKRVAAALRLKSTYSLALTGTPFLNRPIELFNLLDMAQPGKWNLGSYGNRYCGGFDYWAGPLKGAQNLSELRSKLGSVMIRRLKRDVLDDLPAFSRVILPVDIRTVEYRKALSGLNRTNAATKVMDAWHVVGREKAKAAVDWVHDFFKQSEANTKVVLYAHHLDVIDYLKKGLREYGTFSIDGRVPPGKRDALIKGFQEGAKPRVAIINKAGGEGIDLFGKGNVDCSTILFVERQWTPALEWQAEGRLDRIGQTLPVTAYYLAAIDTFDETMAREIDNKRSILDATIEVEQVDLEVKSEIIGSLL